MLNVDDDEDGSLWPGQNSRPMQTAWRADGARLYAIACGNRVKVGVSYDPSKRVKKISSGEGRPARVIESVEVPHDLALTAESYAHWLLRDRHAYGEWFNVEHTEAVSAIVQSAEQLRTSLPVPAFPKPRFRKGVPMSHGYTVSRQYAPRPGYLEELARWQDSDEEIDGSL